MKFQLEHLKKLAHLSKLSLERDEELRLMSELSSVVTWVDILKKADTKNIEPMFHPGDLTLRLRKDQSYNDNSIKRILLNAPQKSNDFFIVPRVVD
jgi:aspartyl-tRNA(Asn)/glutamyl-tRNA(Gln) amidotransferase subunit C